MARSDFDSYAETMREVPVPDVLASKTRLRCEEVLSDTMCRAAAVRSEVPRPHLRVSRRGALLLGLGALSGAACAVSGVMVGRASRDGQWGAPVLAMATQDGAAVPADARGMAPVGMYEGLDMLLRANLRVDGSADYVTYRLAETPYYLVAEGAVPFERQGVVFQECVVQERDLGGGGCCARYAEATWGDDAVIGPTSYVDVDGARACADTSILSPRGNPVLLNVRADVESFCRGDEIRELYANYQAERAEAALREGSSLPSWRAEAYADLRFALDQLALDETALFDWMRACYVDYAGEVLRTLQRTSLQVIGAKEGVQETSTYEFGRAQDFERVAGGRFDAIVEHAGWRLDETTRRLVDGAGDVAAVGIEGFPFWGVVSGEFTGIDDGRLTEPLFAVRRKA